MGYKQTHGPVEPPVSIFNEPRLSTWCFPSSLKQQTSQFIPGVHHAAAFPTGSWLQHLCKVKFATLVWYLTTKGILLEQEPIPFSGEWAA